MKYEPYMNGNRQMAKLVPAVNEQGVPLKYTDTATFMAVFIRTVEAHKRAQVQAKDAYCREIKVCKKCALPASNCKCIAEQAATFSEEFEECEWKWSGDETYWYTIWNYISTFSICYWMYFALCFVGVNLASYDILVRVIVYCLSNTYVKWLFWRLCDYFLPQRTALRIIGWTIENRRRLVHFSFFITGTTALVSLYSVYNLLKPQEETEEQGTRQSTGKPIEVKDQEKENVWHSTNYECTTQDVPIASTSLVGATKEKITDMFSNNICFMTMQYDDHTEHYSQMAVCVRGQKYITNAHAFKKQKNGVDVVYYHIRINVGKIQPGVSQLVHLKLKRSEIYINEKLDLAVFEVLGAPPKKDISKFFAPHTFSGVNDGFLLCTRTDGSMYTRALNNITKTWSPPKCGTADCMLFGYNCPTMTEFGECGALVIVMAPRGPIIGGYHAYVRLAQGKATETAYGICVSREQLEFELKEFDYISSSLALGDIEPGVIALDLVEGDRTVGPLHHKSVINYCETGTANVYGTISGVRPSPRSKVNSTPLREVVEQRFERKAPFGPPVMKGWNVWRQNVLPMLDRTAKYDKSVMTECANAFTHDILEGLKESDPEWKNYVHPLDDYSTVNGINGVQYIDSMNFKSSMGNPWRKTKKSFIVPDPTESKPDGMNFPPHVWDRVTKCHESYMAGKRYMPVFEQHLKDESIPIEKILIEKTRAFSSAGVDFSLEMRKYLLPFVRLVQRNKFVFESGPGTVCQSAEWELIRDYLCVFGDDKIIAGDYKRFDKGMTADIILYAFSVVYAICKEAGYTEEDLKVIVGLAYDVAFPVSNVNGDLIEFFGTNPSGQALTVIINGIVNCLYIRYAFAVLAPKEVSVWHFKLYVHLMTYGDDNIMGVGNAPWFTHSGVVSALATIGVVYTASDKSNRVITYVHIDDESFLKRKWRFDEDVGFYLCPLDEESIFKSLTVWVPSDSVSPGFQMASVVQSAMYEYFYYGKEKFHEMKSFLQEVCMNNDVVRPYIKKSTFPTWEHLVDNFMAASNGMSTKNHGLIRYERVYLEECTPLDEDVEYC
nr:MAG: RNA-dependent RNA polymerase [Chemarfal virus 56]